MCLPKRVEVDGFYRNFSALFGKNACQDKSVNCEKTSANNLTVQNLVMLRKQRLSFNGKDYAQFETKK